MKCLACENLHESDDRIVDEYSDYCPVCENEGARYTGEDRKATYWSVALYVTGQAYGGPEEGGWYYTAGNRVETAKIRVFESYKKAVKYCTKLETEFPDLQARGFTEELPPKGWPTTKPRYC